DAGPAAVLALRERRGQVEADRARLTGPLLRLEANPGVLARVVHLGSLVGPLHVRADADVAREALAGRVQRVLLAGRVADLLYCQGLRARLVTERFPGAGAALLSEHRRHPGLEIGDHPG